MNNLKSFQFWLELRTGKISAIHPNCHASCFASWSVKTKTQKESKSQVRSLGPMNLIVLELSGWYGWGMDYFTGIYRWIITETLRYREKLYNSVQISYFEKQLLAYYRIYLEYFITDQQVTMYPGMLQRNRVFSDLLSHKIKCTQYHSIVQ